MTVSPARRRPARIRTRLALVLAVPTLLLTAALATSVCARLDARSGAAATVRHATLALAVQDLTHALQHERALLTALLAGEPGARPDLSPTHDATSRPDLSPAHGSASRLDLTPASHPDVSASDRTTSPLGTSPARGSTSRAHLAPAHHAPSNLGPSYATARQGLFPARHTTARPGLAAARRATVRAGAAVSRVLATMSSGSYASLRETLARLPALDRARTATPALRPTPETPATPGAPPPHASQSIPAPTTPQVDLYGAGASTGASGQVPPGVWLPNTATPTVPPVAGAPSGTGAGTPSGAGSGVPGSMGTGAPMGMSARVPAMPGASAVSGADPRTPSGTDASVPPGNADPRTPTGDASVPPGNDPRTPTGTDPGTSTSMDADTPAAPGLGSVGSGGLPQGGVASRTSGLGVEELERLRREVFEAFTDVIARLSEGLTADEAQAADEGWTTSEPPAANKGQEPAASEGQTSAADEGVTAREAPAADEDVTAREAPAAGEGVTAGEGPAAAEGLMVRGLGEVDPALPRRLRALEAIGRAEEGAARARAVVTAAFAAGGFTRYEYVTFLEARASMTDALAAYRRAGTLEGRKALARAQKGAEAARLGRLERRALAASPGTPLTARTRAWSTAGAAYVSALQGLQRSAGHELRDQAVAAVERHTRALTWLVVTGVAFVLGMVALGVYLARSVTRPLRGLAAEAAALAGHVAVLEAADSDPPKGPTLVPAAPPYEKIMRTDENPPHEERGQGEVGRLAGALEELHGAAVRIAAGRAAVRRDTAAALGGLGTRHRDLVHRQLAFITALQRDESDPAVLTRLCELDRVTSRLRRNAESLLVLTGERGQRRSSEPVPVDEVLRSVLAEVEDHHRVALRAVGRAHVRGPVVPEVAHMVAELLENALRFSPPDAEVEVVSRAAEDECRITISDYGVGMTAAELAVANARLRGERSFLVAPTHCLGHHVVGRLAERLGVRVSLRESPGCGVTALVALPEELLAVRAREPAESAR